MADDHNLILVWGMETDDPMGAPEAAWISDLLARNVPGTDHYPVALRGDTIEIRAGYDCPVSPLTILNADSFLANYPTPGRLPEHGEILTGLVHIDDA